MTGTDDSGASGPGIVTREFDTTQADPNVEVVSVIAELADEPVEELPPLYSTIHHILEHIYAEPPEPDADVEISFTYYGYRITIEQHGTARFERVDGERAA